MVLFQVHRAAVMRECHHGENPTRVIAGQIPACARVSDRSSYGRQLCAAARQDFDPFIVAYRSIRMAVSLDSSPIVKPLVREVMIVHITPLVSSGYRMHDREVVCPTPCGMFAGRGHASARFILRRGPLHCPSDRRSMPLTQSGHRSKPPFLPKYAGQLR